MQILHINGSVLFEDKSEDIKSHLENAVKIRANLIGADLIGANLNGADLSGANLIGANLVRADLSRANLIGAYLSRANLIGANLNGADLSGANLIGAYLSGANLIRANLSGANGIISFCFGKHLGFATASIIKIGCETNSHNWWLENYKQIGEKEAYTLKQIEAYGACIKAAIKYFK